MKKLFVLFSFVVFTTGFVFSQIPKKMTGITKVDREKWFRTLKWNDEDYYAPNIDRFENSGFTFFKLGDRKWLVEIVTGAGAYQLNYVYSIVSVDKSRWSASKPLRFSSYYYDQNNKVKKEVSKFVVGISSFDAARRELTVYYKGSGLGYCGSLTKYRIENRSAKTVVARLRSCYSSATDWPSPQKWPKARLF